MIPEGRSDRLPGATPLDAGVHFSVWAPASRRVDVVTYDDGSESFHPLQKDEDGYFSGTVATAEVGSRYRYRLDGDAVYPDPASRHQPEGVHGPSMVVDPNAYEWRVESWPVCRPENLVIYELHIGTFTHEGTFDGAIARLPEIAALGVTAVEPMPIAEFPGCRNWGYDGVSLFAPAAVYGGVDGFKRFVDAAHELGLAVILDVVYNHFGPEGNYLPAVTGGRFFTERHRTPWGDGVNYDGPESRPVRNFVIGNAVHWLEEYRVDGLRLDATHAMVDDSAQHLLAALAEKVARLPGPRRILIAEDERNERRLVASPRKNGLGLDAVWSDDLHHQLRRLTAGDSEGYFAHYSGTIQDVVETLRQGWWRKGKDALSLPPRSFVHCIQNHDQVGNRAFGDRIHHEIPGPVYRALSALLLTSPYMPLLWMGQEWAASTPFLYFTDHPEELGRLVTKGRREEFAHFSAFADPEVAESIPDPQAEETFQRSKLLWDERAAPGHAGILKLYKELLHLRSGHPALRARDRDSFSVAVAGPKALLMIRKGEGEGEATVAVVVNFGGEVEIDLSAQADGRADGEVENPRWRILLSTEEDRFGGEGDWESLDSAGALRMRGAGAVILELTTPSGASSPG